MRTLPNEGTWDRVIRIVIGIGLAIVATQVTAWSLTLYVVAAIALVTGIAGACPLYAVVGIRTCPVRSATRVSRG